MNQLEQIMIGSKLTGARRHNVMAMLVIYWSRSPVSKLLVNWIVVDQLIDISLTHMRQEKASIYIRWKSLIIFKP